MAVSHERTEHSSIIKFIDKLYNLTPLADLPDEAAARKLGETLPWGKSTWDLRMMASPGVGNLLSAFDNNRLLGITPMLNASYAMIPNFANSHASAVQRGRLPHLSASPQRIRAKVARSLIRHPPTLTRAPAPTPASLPRVPGLRRLCYLGPFRRDRVPPGPCFHFAFPFDRRKIRFDDGQSPQSRALRGCSVVFLYRARRSRRHLC